MKFNKRFPSMVKYIKSELKTDRHILACLGSSGLIFVSDIIEFKKYLKEIGEFDLLIIINNNRSLTNKEIGKLRRDETIFSKNEGELI